MELLLLNTPQGLKPCYDEDFDMKKMLRLNEVYKCKIKLARNLDFHRKYFALINCAWEYQRESTTQHFKNIENFRKTVEIAAGHTDVVYNLRLKEWVEVPRSIAFDKMDEDEFRDLYERVKDVLFSVFLKGIKEDEFMNNLINF